MSISLPTSPELRALIDVPLLASTNGDFTAFPTLGETLGTPHAAFDDPGVVGIFCIVRAILGPSRASLWLVKVNRQGEFAKLWDFQPSPGSRLFADQM